MVLGNSINTDITEKSVFSRTGGWEVGLTEGSGYNFIGGTTEVERNVINGGQESVLVHLETYSNFNFIAGNSIGSDSSSTIVFPNQTVIAVEDAEFNFIQDNLITGGLNGISLSISDYEKPDANFNVIKMNNIVQNSKFGIGIGKGDGNTVVGNFFSKNGNNGYDLGNNNKWDDGFFGDTAYIIPNNGIDNRPMMSLPN